MTPFRPQGRRCRSRTIRPCSPRSWQGLRTIDKAICSQRRLGFRGNSCCARPPYSLRHLYTRSRFPATPRSWMTPGERTGHQLREGYGNDSVRPGYKALAVNYAIAQGLLTRLDRPGTMTAEGCQATIARAKRDDGEESHLSRRSPICARHHSGCGRAERHGAAARMLDDLGPNTDVPVPFPGRQC
jgi:hypothetical protein